MENIRIILLDGVSSSGKTSIAKHLHQSCSDHMIFRFSIDDYLHCFPNHILSEINKGIFIDRFDEIICKFHEMIRFLSTLYDLIVVDHVLRFPHWQKHLFDRVQRQFLLYVQVFCPLNELERREINRGDRKKGLARSQFKDVYKFQDYDLRVNTSTTSIQEAVNQILKYLNKSFDLDIS